MINSRQNLLSYLIKNVASVGLTTKVHGVRILCKQQTEGNDMCFSTYSQ